MVFVFILKNNAGVSVRREKDNNPSAARSELTTTFIPFVKQMHLTQHSKVNN